MDERKFYIGGTDVAGIMGASKWKTRLSVWMQKTGQGVPVEENVAMEVGTALEQLVADMFEKRTGKKVSKRGVGKTLYHKKYPFLGANLDRTVEGENAFLECKTAGETAGRSWEGDEIPVDYFYQCVHYLNISGCDKCYLACLIGNRQFVIKEIFRDEKIINTVQKVCVDFWNDYVVPKKMPLEMRAIDTDNLSALFPVVKEPNLEEITDDEIRKKLEIFEGTEADFKALELQYEQQKNEIKALIQDKEGIKCGQYVARWFEKKSGGLDTKRFKEERPEIYKEFSKSGVIRQFQFKVVEK